MSTQEFSTPIRLPDKPQRTVQSDWLPRWAQVRRALQLRFAALPAPILELSSVSGIPEPVAGDTEDAVEIVRDHPLTLTMRQGLGLVCGAGLLAGLIPFILHWMLAAQVGTAWPIAEFARGLTRAAGTNPGFLAILADTGQNIAGLPTPAPGWLAAGLTALGEWLNWPLRWLTIWLVYGLGVLVTTRFYGATSTLQQFYAATSYAAVPLLLLALSLVPCLGALIALVGIAWAAAVYVAAIRAVTGVETAKAILSVLMPAVVVLLLGAVALLSIGTTVWRILF